MAAKLTYDPPNKLIICKAGVTLLDACVDIYSDTKEDWKSDSYLNKFRFPISPVGGNPIKSSKGVYIPNYYFLKTGWRIRPQEANHTLEIEGGILLTLEEVDPFIPTLGAYNVQVKYSQPVKAETVNRGGSGLTTEEHDQLMATALETTAQDIQTMICRLYEGNNQKTFFRAATQIPSRKVDVGRLNYIVIETKEDTDPDWSSPVVLKMLYAWYANMGDWNVLRIGEDGY